MDLNISQRRALVLGASRGLGAAIAKSLLREGVTVYGAARNSDDIDRMRSTLDAEYRSKLHAVQLDLADPASVQRVTTALLADGGVDILINNTGGPPAAAASAVDNNLWAGQFQQMAVSLFTITQALLPAMLERKWGRILTIASSGVPQPIPNLAISNAIRASVVGWSKTLASEVAAHGVTVNVLIPGRIHTDRVDALDQIAATKQGKTAQEVAAASIATIPAGRYGKPEEFAAVATFLASEQASYVTGSMIRVDGGLIRSV
jgi:3-oxoacyl-[acyl-carrier protein] reductase